MRQQGALALDAPGVAGQLAIAAHHPMARNHHRQRIGGAGAGHRAHRARRANARGQLTVADGVPAGNIAQRLPHPLLKSRAANIQRQAQISAGARHPANHLRHQGFVVRVARQQLGARKAVL